MKKPVLLALPILSLCLYAQSEAQTITTNPLAESDYCVGEVMTVSFVVVGGGFTPGNAFIVQLSDASGDFNGSEKRILGSTNGTGSGSVDVPIPFDLVSSSTYRVRVVASNPVTPGTDNGSDVGIYQPPSSGIEFDEGDKRYDDRSPRYSFYTFTDIPVQLRYRGESLGSYLWNFGGGSSPVVSISQTPPPVTYLRSGPRTVRFTGTGDNGAECEVSTSTNAIVFEHNPTIPADAIIVTDDVVVDTLPKSSDISYWVCPGGRLTLLVSPNDGDHGVGAQNLTIYVEFGAVLNLGDRVRRALVYAKGGSEVRNDRHGYSIALLAEREATISEDLEHRIYRTGTITYDYSNVPANGCPSLAPYTIKVEPDSRAVHMKESDEGDGKQYVVASGGDLTSVGDANVYLVESGGTVRLRGSNAKVYLKSGATLDVMSGSNNRIFYEAGATLTNVGEDPILLPSSGITFIGQISSVEEQTSDKVKHLDLD